MVALLGALSALMLASALPVQAITGGVPDGTGRPNVAVIVFYSDGVRYRCSATLVSPNVLVTAAHCTFGTDGKTAVSFQSVIAEQSPSGFPVASPASAGYTGTEVGALPVLWGTAYAHPDYSNFTDLRNWNDVGVIVLDAAVPTVPAPLPPLDYLDGFAQPLLNKTLFTVVGYGTEVRKPDAGPQKPLPMSYPLLRRATTSPGQKLMVQILQLNGNINDTRGGGGTCFGDSGGPVFLNNYLVAVTSYGYTDNCRYIDGYQRTDIEGVRAWIAHEVSDHPAP
jgi:hypothetical protein